MNILDFYSGSAVDEWIERARGADLVEVGRRLQPRLRRLGAEWVGPCPSGCAQEDGFAVAPGKGVFLCRPSRVGGDIIAMVMHALGCGFNDACAFIVGQERPSQRVLPFDETLRRQRSRAEHWAAAERRRAECEAANAAERIIRRDVAAQIGERSGPASGTIGASYFVGRGLDPAAFPELRFHPRLEHWFGGGCMPAVVARVTSSAGEFLGVHATFLTEDGRANRALGDKRKLMLGGVRGGGVRFGWIASDDAYVVGEGIESTLSAMCLWGLRNGCAALSAPGMENLLLPADVRHIVIAADNDLNLRGQNAAHRARCRWQAEGRQVRVRMPKTPGYDYNDLLFRKMALETSS